MRYKKWVSDILIMTKDEFHLEQSTIVFQWAKYEDPEQNLIVEIENKERRHT